MLQQTPHVVRNLIIINILFYIGSGLIGEGESMRMFAGTYPGSPFFKPWQIITHMFMHGGLGHIFFNMFALYMFGSQLERLWGSQRFLNYYLVSGLGGFLLHEFFIGYALYQDYGSFFPAIDALIPEGVSPLDRVSYMEILYGRVVGASGAVFGLLLAFGMLFPNTRLMLLFPPIPIKAKYFVFGYGAIELLLAI